MDGRCSNIYWSCFKFACLVPSLKMELLYSRPLKTTGALFIDSCFCQCFLKLSGKFMDYSNDLGIFFQIWEFVQIVLSLLMCSIVLGCAFHLNFVLICFIFLFGLCFCTSLEIEEKSILFFQIIWLFTFLSFSSYN